MVRSQLDGAAATTASVDMTIQTLSAGGNLT